MLLTHDQLLDLPSIHLTYVVFYQPLVKNQFFFPGMMYLPLTDNVNDSSQFPKFSSVTLFSETYIQLGPYSVFSF